MPRSGHVGKEQQDGVLQHDVQHGTDREHRRYRFTERHGRPDPPARNKTRRNRTHTPQSTATKCKAEPNQTPYLLVWGFLHTGRKAGLNHLSRGTSKAAHQAPASGANRGIRARPSQGRAAPAQGNAKLPESPRDESGPKEARPTCLHRLVSQVAEQRQGPKASEGARGCAQHPSKGYSCRVDDGNVTHHEPAQKHKHDIPTGPGFEGTGDNKRVWGAEWGPWAGRGAGWSGSAGEAAEASAGASGTSNERPEAQPPEEEASAGPAEGMAGGEEGVGNKR
jgi:hypothetical protein